MDLSIIVNILGSGAAVAVVNWIYQHQAGRVHRRAAWLEKQLHQLYGPLCFLISANDEILRHGRLLGKAFEEQYVKPKYAEAAHDQIQGEVKDTIAIQNRYTQLMIDNNAKAARLIRENYALIDPDDAAVLQTFVMDNLRWEEESPAADKQPQLPMRVVLDLPSIFFHRPETVQRVTEKFAQKQRELHKLTGVKPAVAGA